jgi:hypothetical protein
MKSILDLTKFIGKVTVRNEAGDEAIGCNLVTYTGGDILAQLLAGNNAYRIQYVAFEYQNTAGAPAPSPAARSNTNALLLAYAGSFGYLRGSLVAAPALSASDVNHNFNRALFTALGSGPVGTNGVAFSAAANSKVFAVSLLAAPTGSASGDIIYARHILSTPIAAVGAGQVTCVWSTEAL